jgi:hypothetical protein
MPRDVGHRWAGRLRLLLPALAALYFLASRHLAEQKIFSDLEVNARELGIQMPHVAHWISFSGPGGS